MSFGGKKKAAAQAAAAQAAADQTILDQTNAQLTSTQDQLAKALTPEPVAVPPPALMPDPEDLLAKQRKRKEIAVASNKKGGYSGTLLSDRDTLG